VSPWKIKGKWYRIVDPDALQWGHGIVAVEDGRGS
jgi:hypothetical protein